MTIGIYWRNAGILSKKCGIDIEVAKLFGNTDNLEKSREIILKIKKIKDINLTIKDISQLKNSSYSQQKDFLTRHIGILDWNMIPASENKKVKTIIEFLIV